MIGPLYYVNRTAFHANAFFQIYVGWRVSLALPVIYMFHRKAAAYINSPFNTAQYNLIIPDAHT